MKIELNYTTEEATRLFESFGLSVENDTVVTTTPIHGSAEHSWESKQLVVVNPTTNERVLLENALQRLIRHKIITLLFWSDKLEVLDALNCKAAKSPFNEILQEDSITK